MRRKACVKGKVGLSAGMLMRKGLIGGEIYKYIYL